MVGHVCQRDEDGQESEQVEDEHEVLEPGKELAADEVYS